MANNHCGCSGSGDLPNGTNVYSFGCGEHSGCGCGCAIGPTGVTGPKGATEASVYSQRDQMPLLRGLQQFKDN